RRTVLWIINAEMTSGMPWCVPHLNPPVSVKKQGFTAQEREVNRGLGAVVLANPCFRLGTLVDLVLHPKLPVTSFNQLVNALDQSLVECMAHECGLGSNLAHGNIPALVVPIGVGDQHVIDLLSREANGVEVGEQVLTRGLVGSRIHQERSLAPGQQVQAE